MRKIRNPQNHAADPSLMFARGVEQLVRDNLYHPARKDARELQDLRQKALRQEPRGNLFNILLRQFTV